MWTSESFATLERLVAFLNDRRIGSDRCKIVVARDDDGAQVFHLLYQTLEDAVGVGAVAQAETEALDGSDADDAVGAAEAIIAEASRDE